MTFRVFSQRLMLGVAPFALLLPGIAAGQDVYGRTTARPDDQMTSAPLDGGWNGDAALAPMADALDDRLFSDRTPTAELPETVYPDANITLPGSSTSPGETDESATILADNLELQGDDTLIAAGGVVVWYQGARLVASRIVVDGGSGDMTIEGPIHLSRPGAANPDMQGILIADSAQLDREMQDGIIRGARFVIDRELQLASKDATRSQNGRITKLNRVAASACRVCAGPNEPPPLWEIRAKSITHDAQTRDLYFENPQFRVLGAPVIPLPATITAPDPTVERRSGFLQPSIRTTSSLGFGVKVPYFQTLGDSADLTITPYISASRTTTLELRYRQAFRNGVTQWQGAITRDDILKDDIRGYLFGAALFELPRDYNLGIQLQLASDRGYLLDYDITEADRLWSGVTLERIRRDKLFFGRVGNYHSLRDSEDNRTSPKQVLDVIWLRNFTPDYIGGVGQMEWSIHAHRRPSDDNIDGRDEARASVGLDWRRSEILPGGVVGATLFGLDADLYRIAQDDRYDLVVARADPLAGVEFRWPLATYSGGATHMVEPVAQLLWSPKGQDEDDIPNEDSRLIEFDEGNLFSDNRFPGWDARETGLRANLGATWTRIDPTGWSLGMTAGRVFRDSADEQFADTSPLAGKRSDWLLATHYDSGDGLAIVNRALFDDSFEFSRNELRVGWLREDLQVSAGHLWINSDDAESREDDTSELTADVGWQIAEGWWGNFETRYDFIADSGQEAALDVVYQNECVNVEFGLSRRFADSDTIRPETSFDFSVRLAGFGRQGNGIGTVARRSCIR